MVRERRPWLIMLVAVAVMVTVIGVRATESIKQLHASTAAARTPETAPRTTPQPSAHPTSASPHPTTSPAPTLSTLAGYLHARIGSGGSVSVAAVDLTSGRHFEFGETSGMIDASISKLDILEAVLLHHQDTGAMLAGSDDQLATAMIEHSDNDAGQALWNQLGSAPAIAAANARLGLRHTVPDPTGYYGLTTSSAGDQVALLRNLINADGPLTAQSRAYALHLLHNVEADQRWGVSAAADPHTTFAVKNGWIPIDDDGGRWVVNSDGIVTVAGHSVLMAVMTRHNADERTGIKLVEAISRAVAAALT